MAVSLQIIFTDYDSCETLFAYDNTPAYNAISAQGGWGTPNPATADITAAVLTLSYGSYAGTTAVFNFTVVTNVITAATLTFAGGASTNILADLESTTFPFTSLNPFNFLLDYGTALPDMEDQIITLTWNVSGTGPFNYTTTKTLVIDCTARQCIINNLLTQAINSDLAKQTSLANAYLSIAQYAADAGSNSNASAALVEAGKICDQTTNNCGCS